MQALRDPDLPFNLGVRRAHILNRRFKLGLVYQQLKKDDYGINHILNTLKLIYEES